MDGRGGRAGAAAAVVPSEGNENDDEADVELHRNVDQAVGERKTISLHKPPISYTPTETVPAIFPS